MKNKCIAAFMVAAGLYLPGIAAAQSAAPDPPESRLSLTISTASHHFRDRTFQDRDKHVQRPWNETNPGIGLEYRVSPRFHVRAGYYRNSIYRDSFYAAAGLETSGKKLFGAGIEAGAASGYYSPVMPVGFLYGRIGSRDGRINLKINAVPSKKPIVAAEVRIRLGR